ncbi:alpha-amylase [Aquibacillus halophilus]|uniref:Alpha-amylase n=1 Tax=Aquibacillus halophilus TaxID=930132 RepID=A0A6A8DF13_9BACI|nr:alpha-amylase family glycosyl hydrolase [Aquibacillus halophilus]MRH44194.1 alpha-amylase [Aquibacillus halophilus]
MQKILVFLITIPVIFLFANPSYAIEEDIHSWQDETIYYILVDRFTNGTTENDYEVDIQDPNAYHGGDIQGIISKLDHIKQLGFTTINLSPVMSNAEEGYHGFLIDDYQSIEEHFGTMEDLQQLVEVAHEKELKVILDFVVSHTAPNHDLLTSNPDLIADTAVTEDGTILPSPDLDNAMAREYFLEAAAFWIDQANIDGYRLYTNENTSREFINDLVETTQSMKTDFLVMGESIDFIDKENTALTASVNHQLNEKLSSVFSSYGNSIEPLLQEWPEVGSIINGFYLDSHQTVRFTREAVKNAQNPITRWKLGLTYLYTVPGIPIVYQGSEVPMDNGEDRPDHRMAQTNGGDDEFRNYIEQLAAIQKQFPALSYGDLEVIDSNGAMTMYKREYQDETIFVAINNDVETKTITIKDVPDGMQLTGLLQDNIVRELKNDEYKIALDRETADIFMVEEDTGMNWLFISFVVLVLGGFVTAVIFLSIKGKRLEQ